MAVVNKIDSNIAVLAIAPETTIGVLPGSPVWTRHAPNSFSDFGPEVVKTASKPLANNRQNKKAEITGLNVSAGFQEDLSFYNQLDLFESLMFASTRTIGKSVAVNVVDIDAANPDEYECTNTTGFVVGYLIKGFGFANSANNAVNVITAVTANTSVEVATGLLVAEPTPPTGAYIKVVGVQAAAGDIDVDIAGDFATYTSTTLDFTTLGLVPGQSIFVGGDSAGNQFTNAANNGFKRVRSIAARALVVDKSELPMITEANTTSTIQIFFGDVLKNETDALIKRTSFTMERILGAPVVGNAATQSEVCTGQVASECTINIPSEDLMKTDWQFKGLNHYVRLATSEGGLGPLQSSVVTPFDAGVFNTSADITRINISVVSSTAEAINPLMAFHDELTLTINNNLTVNKSIGNLGGFDVSAGNFSVSGSLRSYLSSLTAVNAIRNNSDLTLDTQIVKNNRAICIDLPLITLGDGKANLEADKPIMIPFNMDAATAVSINASYNHTMMLTLFHYVPNAAQ